MLSIENIKDLLSDHFIDKLDNNGDESTEKLDYLKQMVDISFDSFQEKQLSYFEQFILKKVCEFRSRTVVDVWIV